MDDSGKSKEELIAELGTLRRQEAKWRSLVMDTPNFILVVNREGTVELINHTQPGITQEEVIGNSLYEFIHPDYRKTVRDCVEHSFDSGEKGFYECIGFGPQGKNAWYEAFVGPILEDGEVVSVSVIATDTTRRKEAEQSLEAAREELECRVEERTAELSQANEHLQQEIEERKQTEEKVAIFQRFVEASGQGFGMTSLDGRAIYGNPTLLRLCGVTVETSMGKDFTTFHADEDQQKIKEEVIPTTMREGQWVGELTIRSQEGPGIPVMANFFLVRDDQGQPSRIACVITDISELKNAQSALRESEERYRTLVETSPDAVVMIDVQGRIIFASERLAAMYGVERVEDVYGQSPLVFVAPEDHERVGICLKRTLQRGGTTDEEFAILRPDGTTFPAEISVTVVHDTAGHPVALTALLRDISQRKADQEALRQSLDELRAVYDSAIDGILMADVETKKFVRTNRSMCKMLGYTEEELLLLAVPDVHPQDALPETLEHFSKVVDGYNHLALDMPFQRKDDTIFYTNGSASRVVYDGRPCIVGIFRDVTERKEAREALQREHQVLRQMLQAQDQDRQLVAYDIHDGVAQHLTAAMMQFQACSQIKEPESANGGECHNTGVTMLEKALAEVRRLISGIRPPILDESGIVAAVGHLIHDIRSQEGSEVDFRSEVTFDRLEPALEDSIFRIIQESLTNAHRHGKADHVRIELAQKDHRVRILVEDNGTGFNVANIGRESYGLAGIRERARVLGGSASIESEPGHGTRVQVEVPMVLANDANGNA